MTATSRKEQRSVYAVFVKASLAYSRKLEPSLRLPLGPIGTSGYRAYVQEAYTGSGSGIDGRHVV